MQKKIGTKKAPFWLRGLKKDLKKTKEDLETKRQYADPKEKVTYYRAKGVLEELEYIKDFKEELKRIFKLTEEEVSTLFIIGEKIKSVKEPHLETYLSEM